MPQDIYLDDELNGNRVDSAWE